MGQATEGRNERIAAPGATARPALALLEPDRPHNLGAAVRLCACLDLELHLIEPLGFPLSDRRIREAALDYGAWVSWLRHRDAETFAAWCAERGRRIVLLTTRAELAYPAVRFTATDILLLGNERHGAPAALHARADLRVRVPMAPGRRALNLVVAGAIVLGEALRQSGALDELERRRERAGWEGTAA